MEKGLKSKKSACGAFIEKLYCASPKIVGWMRGETRTEELFALALTTTGLRLVYCRRQDLIFNGTAQN